MKCTHGQLEGEPCDECAAKQECVRLPNDTKIKFCNAMDAIRRHALLDGKMTCQHCAVYITWGDGDLCPKGKHIIAIELAYADTKIEP